MAGQIIVLVVLAVLVYPIFKWRFGQFLYIQRDIQRMTNTKISPITTMTLLDLLAKRDR